MADLKDGETIEVKGSAARPYKLVAEKTSKGHHEV